MLKLLLSLTLTALVVVTPQTISWKTLGDVKFTKKWSEEEGMYILYPEFGQSVKKLEGKEVAIKGYVIPVDYNENYYVLSAFPYSSCFFCGGAGPESVMSLLFKSKQRKFKTDEVLTFKGRLKLNSTDILELNYILMDAELYEP